MSKRKLDGFSLMEMMIVLLITAIVAAAGAPLVTKKMMSDTAAGNSPWIYTGHGQSIAYNLGGKTSTAIIGATKVPDGTTPKLYIESSGNEAQIGFGKKGNNKTASLSVNTADNTISISDIKQLKETVALGLQQQSDMNHGEQISGAVIIGSGIKVWGNNQVTIGYAAKGQLDAVAIGPQADTRSNAAAGSVAIGYKAKTAPGAVAIGPAIEALGNGAIAIGGSTTESVDPRTGGIYYHGATAKGQESIIIGMRSGTTAEATKSIAIGSASYVYKPKGIAIGYCARVEGSNSIAIGDGAKATGDYSVAIGNDARASRHQIVLGTAEDTVYIPGNLVVGQRSVLGLELPTGESSLWLRAYPLSINGVASNKQGWVYDRNDKGIMLSTSQNPGTGMPDWVKGIYMFLPSDRRLKNVGDEFTAGVNELSKLDFFHYTFKKDEAKTPHVGVIAQDLQKVFPDAVTKNDDGFLHIRWEEMFYAAINAIKELNTKISEIADNLTSTNAKFEEQAKIIKEQQNTIENQQKTIDSLIKRIESIEKKV